MVPRGRKGPAFGKLPMTPEFEVIYISENGFPPAALEEALASPDAGLRVRRFRDLTEAIGQASENPWDVVVAPLADKRLMGSLPLLAERAAVVVTAGAEDGSLEPTLVALGASDVLIDGRYEPRHVPARLRALARLRRAEETNRAIGIELRETSSESDRVSALLDALLSTAPVGMAFFDLELRYVRINQALAAINGKPIEEHIGRHLSEMVPGVWKFVEPFLHRVIQTGEPVLAIEFSAATPARTGDWQCSYYPVRGREGNLLGVGVVVLDVTERKRVEKELTSARDSAEAANRAKDQFLAVLSHELRTPLTPVLTLVSALEGDATIPAAVREDLQVIRRNVELEARLIDDLLDLTRISKGKLRLNLETVDLHAKLGWAIDICRPDLRAKGLELSVSMESGRHHVKGDSARLIQVFWNLLKNAVKFTPAGGKITVRSEQDGEHIRVQVQDTGIGIDAEVMPRIFFAFEQAEQSIVRRYGGLGLGLAISKSLVDLHGGRLSVSSAGVGKGSTFTVELLTTEPQANPRGAARRQTVGGALRGTRILMVDDHIDTSQAMKRLLERLGYEVQVADSMRSALAASDQPFDLLISDIGLPDGSGLDLLRELLHRGPMKAIALSGFGMEDDIRKSKDAGFAEHLTKPVNFEHLESVIERLMK